MPVSQDSVRSYKKDIVNFTISKENDYLGAEFGSEYSAGLAFNIMIIRMYKPKLEKAAFRLTKITQHAF